MRVSTCSVAPRAARDGSMSVRLNLGVGMQRRFLACAMSMSLAAFLMPLNQAGSETAPKSETAKTVTVEQGAAADPTIKIEAAPRPAQIEPIVAPVKREVPKTPAIRSEPASVESSGSSKSQKSAKPSGTASKSKPKLKVVGDRPNCDAGFKVDSSGKACVRIAQSEGPARKKKK